MNGWMDGYTHLVDEMPSTSVSNVASTRIALAAGAAIGGVYGGCSLPSQSLTFQQECSFVFTSLFLFTYGAIILIIASVSSGYK